MYLRARRGTECWVCPAHLTAQVWCMQHSSCIAARAAGAQQASCWFACKTFEPLHRRPACPLTSYSLSIRVSVQAAHIAMRHTFVPCGQACTVQGERARAAYPPLHAHPSLYACQTPVQFQQVAWSRARTASGAARRTWRSSSGSSWAGRCPGQGSLAPADHQARPRSAALPGHTAPQSTPSCL